MTQAQQAPAAANANVTSTGWNGAGVSQGAPGWCFAAAEQMVQRAFGVTVNQVEVAHNIMLARGRSGDPAGNAVAYYTGLRGILNQHNLGNLNWATVQQYVRADQTLFNYLRTEYGNPPLTGRTFTRGNAPDAATIVQTINANGIVIVGTTIHWKIVYGYASDANGQITSYRVYDPWNNGTDHAAMAPATMANGVEETYYVTA